MTGQGVAIVIHKAVNLVTDATQVAAPAVRFLGLDEHVSQNSLPVERMLDGVGGDEIVRGRANEHLPANGCRNIVGIKPGEVIISVIESSREIAVRIIVQ